MWWMLKYLKIVLPISSVVIGIVIIFPHRVFGLDCLVSDGANGAGGAGGAVATNGTAGTDGGCGTATSGTAGGGGGGGSAGGGNGGAGAGGGVLIKNTSGTMSISGTIDNRGGGSNATNGGTVKLFYSGTAPSTTGISSGRTYSATAAANAAPAAPTLLTPASGATGTSISPLFQFRSTDADNDYLRYKVLVYNSDCSTGLQTFDQTLSQVGWIFQDVQSNTAYTGNSILTSSTIAKFGGSNLSASTQYCWKAAAIDPAGANTFSSYSATQLFTTGLATGNVNINGGANITGGAIIR